MYRIEWIWLVAPIGALTLLTLPLVGVVFAALLVLLFAAAILVALVGAIVAIPFLLARAVRRLRRSGRALPADTAQAAVSRATKTGQSRGVAVTARPGLIEPARSA